MAEENVRITSFMVTLNYRPTLKNKMENIIPRDDSTLCVAVRPSWEQGD